MKGKMPLGLRGAAYLCGVAILVLFFSGCQKKKSNNEVAPLDQVGGSPVGTSQPVLHKTFTVRNAVSLPFEIPAHAAMPHLRGNFKSFATKVGIQSNEHSADVDFLVLNEQQYADFTNGNPSATVFSMDAAHDQTVDVELPPSFNQSAKYYLVFRNTPGGDAKKTVQADLTVEY
jgi:hypothetical protein